MFLFQIWPGKYPVNDGVRAAESSAAHQLRDAVQHAAQVRPADRAAPGHVADAEAERGALQPAAARAHAQEVYEICASHKPEQLNITRAELLEPKGFCNSI